MSSLDKVVPPKKSKAARKTHMQVDDVPDVDSANIQEQNGHVEKDANKVSDTTSGSGLDQSTAVNIFREEIVEGKRKRNAPQAEQTLKDWLKKNFLEKENSFLLISDMYQSYLEACSSVATFALDYMQFQKTVMQIYPKGLALVEDSVYKDAIREKKPKKKSMAKIQADSLHLKMKDILKEAITDLGNPRKGIGFSAIKNLVAGKFPALRVDLRVNFLKNAIFRELRFGHIECVRGVGACGYYRLPRTPEQEAEELEAEKKEAKEKALKKKEKMNAVTSDEKADGDENPEKTDDEPEKEEADKKEPEGLIEGETEELTKAKPTKKGKSKKRKKLTKDYDVMHGEPQHIEDAFPLAMTYNSEPKEASVAKIRKYVKDFYKEEIAIDRLKKCLDTGVEHGFWFQVTGQGSGSGSFRLTISEFDPLADDDLTGKVMNAIVACTEPKQSSALLLKKYVQDYHPNFRIAERPRLFKLALQRAVSKNKIVQLSGIGATGTFQLVEPFLPSPTILQGKDTASDYAESNNGVIESAEAFQDAYQPRPTRRRGMGRPGAATISRLDPSAVVRHTSTKTSRGKGNQRRSVTGRSKKAEKRNISNSGDSSEEESEDEPPRKRTALTSRRKASSPPTKKQKVADTSNKKPSNTRRHAPVSKTQSESESEEYDSEPEAYTPRKTASRGGARGLLSTGKPGKGSKASASTKQPVTVTKGKKAVKEKAKTYDEEEEEEEEEDQQQPNAKVSGKAKSSAKKKKPKVSARKTVIKGKAVTQHKSEASDDEPEEPASKLRAGRFSSAARMRAQPPSEDGDEKAELMSSKSTVSHGIKVTVVSSNSSKSPGGSSKSPNKPSKASAQAVSLDKGKKKQKEKEVEKKPTAKKAKGGKKKGGKTGKSRK